MPYEADAVGVPSGGGAKAAMVTIATLGAALGAGILAAMPTTVITEDWGASRAAISAVLPESWQFFTRDPTTASLVVYDVDEATKGRLVVEGTLPQTSASNLFGISRDQRSQDTEKAVLANESTSWVECGGMKAAECLAVASSTGSELVDAAERTQHFCGDHILAEQAPVPFAFRNSTDETVQVLRATRIEARC